MHKAATLAKPSRQDVALLAVLRFVVVSGCASALILARYPLPL
ncbi:hypothetical protein [Blastomonas sp. AAP53]|nr:hypothetical protein [Blastomonas sp. AAP53]